MCDITVAVVAPYEKKLERIISRDKITKEKAEARLKSQLSDNELIKRTTYQIDNSSIDVEAQIIEILKKEQIYEKEC
jgi:dephospho-CoA kinase